MVDDLKTDANSARPLRVCPECEFRFQGRRCPLCGWTATTQAPSSQANQPTGPRHDRVAQTFGLSTLFLLVTLVAVCLGVGVAMPGLGILLAVLSVPAFVRASAWAAREESTGRRTDAVDRVGVFIGSLGIIFLIGLAGCTAFFAACWVSCVVAQATEPISSRLISGDAAIVLINVFAGGIALSLVGWLLWKTWPRRGGPMR